MSSDLDIQNAIMAGERNREAKELIQNWCGYARVEKFGGIGIIEAETGLPIGHHSMACDFAQNSGFASWFLEDSALRFHDANCVICDKRQPIRLPNLSKLVARRDADHARTKLDREAEQKNEQDKLNLRSAERANMRSRASVAVCTFLDDLDAFDKTRSNELKIRLIESARLAPELLTPEIVDYLHTLLDAEEYWIEGVALNVLQAQDENDIRLVNYAVSCLKKGRSLSLAISILIKHLDKVNSQDVPDCTRALAHLAMPPRSEFDHGDPTSGDSIPLYKFYAVFGNEIISGIDKLISADVASVVATGARAITALATKHPEVSIRLRRSLIARLTRAEHIPDLNRDHELRDVTHDLSDALVCAFFADPDATDEDLMRYFEGASVDGEERITAIYKHVFDRGTRRYPEPAKISNFAPYRTTLKRLINLAASSDNDQVINKVVEALRDKPDQLTPIAREYMDMLLGAAALADTKLDRASDKSTIVTDKSFIRELEEQNRRQSLYNLRSGFSRWAICGAGTNDSGLSHLSTFLESSHLFSDGYLASLVEELSVLAKRGDGLGTILPFIYRAMVGNSVLVRAAAARAIGEIGRRRSSELPSLMFEAFKLMLLDPYVLVHKSAVDALDDIDFPDDIKQAAYSDLLLIISCYRGNEDQRFLVKCMKMYACECAKQENFLTVTGRLFIAFLREIKPDILLSQDGRWLLRDLSSVQGYPELVLSLVESAHQDYEKEHLIAFISKIPPGSIGAFLPAVSKAVATSPDDTMIVSAVLEILTRDRQWSHAREIAISHQISIPQNPRMRIRYLMAVQLRCQIEFEYFISCGEIAEALSVGNEWDSAASEIHQIQEERKKNDPLRNFL